ncbi:hypothetical protein BSAF29S_01409 [Bacillus safensis subsp. safensis]
MYSFLQEAIYLNEVESMKDLLLYKLLDICTFTTRTYHVELLLLNESVWLWKDGLFCFALCE